MTRLGKSLSDRLYFEDTDYPVKACYIRRVEATGIIPAIQKAIDMANENDMVLILGKGNETYEKLKDEVIYFNDIEEAYHAVAKRQIRESE